MTKAERAIKALREAADALEAMPVGMRRIVPLLGGFIVDVDKLREEATYIENCMHAATVANEETE